MTSLLDSRKRCIYEIKFKQSRSEYSQYLLNINVTHGGLEKQTITVSYTSVGVHTIGQKCLQAILRRRVFSLILKRV